MPASIREQCVQAILARLQAISGFPGLQVLRQPDHEINEYPTLALFEGDKQADDSFSQVTMHDLEIKIEAWVEAVDPPAALIALDELTTAVTVALNADLTLGGLAFDLVEGGDQREFAADGSSAVGSALISYVLRYQTRRGAPLIPA
jgi:hypothetical protein